MTEHLGRNLASWIAAFLAGLAVSPAIAAEPRPGEMSPTISNPPAQYALYGYYPTQWKTFPGSWSEMRPIVVTPPSTPEMPVGIQQRSPNNEPEFPQPKTQLILPPDEPGQPTQAASTWPSSPKLPGSPYGPVRPTTVPTGSVDVPTIPIPDAFVRKTAAYVASNLDPHVTQGSEPVWIRAGTSESVKENKAWLGQPVPVRNPDRSETSTMRDQTKELP